MRNISFLSDYGTKDEFVGVVKSVIRSIAPDAQITDITHGIPRHNIRAGSLALARASQYLNPGVVLAIVDPGVGTDRRGVAVELATPSISTAPDNDDSPSTGDAARSEATSSFHSASRSKAESIHSVFIGPDNGLLAPAVAFSGGAARAVSLTNTDLQIPSAGSTFAGRDIFAPAAAHLCAGVPLEDLGDPIPVTSLMPAVVPSAEIHSDRILAEVLWIDHFGNAQLNIGPDDLSPLGERFTLKILGLPEPIGAEPGIPHIGIPASPLAGTPQAGTSQVSTRQAGTPQASPPQASPTQSGISPQSIGIGPPPSTSQPTTPQSIGISNTSPTQSITTASVATSYAQIGPRDTGLVIDSYGMISIAMRQRPAAEELSLEEGMSVILTPLTGDLVELTPRRKP